MKVKKVTVTDEKEFKNLYKPIKSAKGNDWKKLFASVIASYNDFTPSGSFWYIGDFSNGSVVAAGGDCECCSPLNAKEWLGLSPMEIGKLIHPADVVKMQTYTVYMAQYLASKSESYRKNVKFSMLFRMMNASNEFTWRLMNYPKMVYKNNIPNYVFCKVDDVQHIANRSKSAMFLLDNNTSEQIMYYCDEEEVKLIPFSGMPPLSQREKEILKLLAKGKISKEIASVLNISKNTVENHKQNIFAKTGVRNLAGLINYAHQHLLLEKND